MPSPTSTTVPTLRVSAVASKLSMLPLMMLMISSDRMAIRCSVRVRGSASSSDEAVAEARKPSSHAGIDESVADADGQAPDQLGVDRRLDLDARAGHGLDALGDGREIGGFEGLGAGDGRDDDPMLPLDESLELIGDAGQDREPAAPGEKEDEVQGRRADARSQEARDDRSAVVPGDGRVVDDRGRLLHADELDGAAELVEPGVERPVAAGELQRGFGIPAGGGRRAGHQAVGPPAAGPPAADSAVSYTHLRAHETRHDLVCRLR